ncbi:MAG: tetratricopeptide repeat protein, partial [Bdellovibrionales bacterium]|nr:tetratricopeptide repeat protein [Bdellovibrionales bacterium]
MHQQSLKKVNFVPYVISIFKTGAAILSATLIFSGTVWAAVPQANPGKIAELKKRSSGLISEAANRRLMRAHELAAAEKYGEAVDLLASYLKNDSIRPGEKAQFEQNLGFILAQKGDHANAIKHLEAALKLNELPYAPTLSTKFAIAQLLLAQEKYQKAIETTEEWFQLAEKPTPEAYIVLATAYSQTGKKGEALQLVETAISKSPKPSETWLLFALGLNFEMEKWDKCAQYLEYLTG